jgi:hypothetical protein
VPGQPLPRLTLRLSDLTLRHLARDLHALALGRRVAAQRGQVEPFVGTDEIDANIFAPRAKEEPEFQQGSRRAAGRRHLVRSKGVTSNRPILRVLMPSAPVTGRTPPRRQGREQAPPDAAVAPRRCQRGDEIP